MICTQKVQNQRKIPVRLRTPFWQFGFKSGGRSSPTLLVWHDLRPGGSLMHAKEEIILGRDLSLASLCLWSSFLQESSLDFLAWHNDTATFMVVLKDSDLYCTLHLLYCSGAGGTVWKKWRQHLSVDDELRLLLLLALVNYTAVSDRTVVNDRFSLM